MTRQERMRWLGLYLDLKLEQARMILFLNHSRNRHYLHHIRRAGQAAYVLSVLRERETPR